MQETGVVLLFKIFGLPLPIAVAYAIIRRGRELFYVLIGGALLYTKEASLKRVAAHAAKEVAHRMNASIPFRHNRLQLPVTFNLPVAFIQKKLCQEIFRMQAIIYAAGVGMRLKSVFDNRPKILLEFAGKSLLERPCSMSAGSWHRASDHRVGLSTGVDPTDAAAVATELRHGDSAVDQSTLYRRQRHLEFAKPRSRC